MAVGTVTGGKEQEAIDPLQRFITVQEDILGMVDSELQAHLSRLRVEPHMYMLRWARLLFAREFSCPELWCVWDAIFAFGASANFQDFVSVALVQSLRETLLKQEDAARSCMSCSILARIMSLTSSCCCRVPVRFPTSFCRAQGLQRPCGPLRPMYASLRLKISIHTCLVRCDDESYREQSYHRGEFNFSVAWLQRGS